MKYNFSEIIQENDDGSFTAKMSFQFGKLEVAAGGKFVSDKSQNTIDVTQFIGHAFEAEIIDGVCVIKAVY